MFGPKVGQQVLDLRTPFRRLQSEVRRDDLQAYPLAHDIDVNGASGFTTRLAQVDQTNVFRSTPRQNRVAIMTPMFKQCRPGDWSQFHFLRQTVQEFQSMLARGMHLLQS
jgi:hypothetical protein